MNRAAIVLLLLGGCTEMPPLDYTTDTAPMRTGPSEGSVSVTEARDWRDLDAAAGKQVSFEGRFDQHGGDCGIVTLDSGVKIYIPHFDLWARDQAWFKYVGRRVQAGGRLHTYTRDVPGYQGPSIDINTFHVLE